MAVRRRTKRDHIIHADMVDSKAKEGVWFSERKSFKANQKKIMAKVKEQIDWLSLPSSILAISREPHGIVVIAPNPSLPGIIVLADGTTQSNTKKLQSKYLKIVSDAAASERVRVERGPKK